MNESKMEGGMMEKMGVKQEVGEERKKVVEVEEEEVERKEIEGTSRSELDDGTAPIQRGKGDPQVFLRKLENVKKEPTRIEALG